MVKLIMLFVAAFSISSHAPIPATDAFKWMLGSWQIQAGNSLIVEQWTVANDSTLSGRSFFIKDGKDTIPQETIELAFRKGEWYYIPIVQGQNEGKPVWFKLIHAKGQEFISENPEHDFPQRISYRRWKDQLFASIEGRKNGVFRKQNFDFTRVPE